MTEPNEAKYSLIVTIVSKGYADIVVAAAKSAGARGGTLLYAYGSGIHETEKFLNILIEPEKEIVLTLVKSEIVKKVVSEITEKAGLAKPGAGVTFVLPVTRTAGIVTDASGKLIADEAGGGEPVSGESAQPCGEGQDV
jgi:nitrogen regulatory protein PII